MNFIIYIKNLTYLFTISWGILFGISFFYNDSLINKYLEEITYFYHAIICLLLIILFNPIRPFKYNPVYRKIIFTAASYMFISLNLMEILEQYIIKPKKIIDDINKLNKNKYIQMLELKF